MKRSTVFLIVLAVALCCAPAALAGTVGTWTQVTPNDLVSLTEVGLARTPNGVLHVAYAVDGTSSTSKVMYRQISAAGDVSIATPIVQGWDGVDNPAILYNPAADNLRVFLPGICQSLTPDSGFYTATAPLGGNAWSSPAHVYGGSSYASSVRAIQSSGATTLQTWTGTTGVWVHAGLSSLTAPYEYSNHQLGGTGYHANLVEDSSDVQTCWVGWWVIPDAAHKPGIWVNRVNGGTGVPIGACYCLPGSNSTYEGHLESSDPGSTLPMVTRSGGVGGAYVAGATGYPSTRNVRVWSLKVVNDKPSATWVDVAPGGAEKEEVALAAAPDYRLWVLWTQREDERVAVYACRSNTAATAFGAPVKIYAPSGATPCWYLTASAQQGVVDVLAHLKRGASGSSTWHTQLRPGLTATLSRTTLKAGLKYKITVIVKDAGVAVKGAKVKIGTRIATTNSGGKAVLSVGPYAVGKVKVTVSKSEYTTHTTWITVKR